MPAVPGALAAAIAQAASSRPAPRPTTEASQTLPRREGPRQWVHSEPRWVMIGASRPSTVVTGRRRRGNADARRDREQSERPSPESRRGVASDADPGAEYPPSPYQAVIRCSASWVARRTDAPVGWAGSPRLVWLRAVHVRLGSPAHHRRARGPPGERSNAATAGLVQPITSPAPSRLGSPTESRP
jgi:hypothetical protein